MRTLLVASGGGHLTQLQLMRDRLRPKVGESVWVTYNTSQTKSVLEDEQVVWCHHPTTRNLPNAIRNYRLAGEVLREYEISRVVSTGAATAVPFMIRARQKRIACHYIESATRVTEPSLSGRMLEYVPGVRRYTQHPSWHRSGWQYRGSVFDGFTVKDAPSREVLSIFVSLGTHASFRFTALVERMAEMLGTDDDVVWQLGATSVGGLPGEVHSDLDAEAMEHLVRDVDVVVAHAGIGIALTCLLAGRVPVLVPRRAARGEHVDDHQRIAADELARSGLAVVREVEDLDRDALRRAAGLRITQTSTKPFVLDE